MNAEMDSLPKQGSIDDRLIVLEIGKRKKEAGRARRRASEQQKEKRKSRGGGRSDYESDEDDNEWRVAGPRKQKRLPHEREQRDATKHRQTAIAATAT